MNVFLFELDSVRNSEDEIRAGQKALVDQWITYGNNVVLTMNQVVDSMAFLQSVYDEKKYEYLVKIIELGKIKVNRFTDVKTGIVYMSPSHYLQHSLEMALTSPGKYHFSSKFIDEKDSLQMKLALNAVRYSIPYIIDEEIDRIENGKVSKNRFAKKTSLSCSDHCPIEKAYIIDENYAVWTPEQRSEEIEALRKLKKYIQIVLLLSEKNTTDIYPKENIPEEDKLCGYLKMLAGAYGSASSVSPLTVPEIFVGEEDEYILVLRAVEYMLGCYRRYEAKARHSELNRRSVWYRIAEDLYAQGGSDNRLLAQAIEDVSDIFYNFALQYSIDNIAFTVKSTDPDYIQQFEQAYIAYHKAGKHIYSWDENSTLIEFLPSSDVETEQWKNASEILDMNSPKSAEDKSMQEQTIETSENLEKKSTLQRAFWKKKTRKNLRKKTLSAIAYIIVFVGVDIILNSVQDCIKSWLGAVNTDIILTILGAVVFGALSSLVCSKLSLPDILESFKQFHSGPQKRRFLRKYDAYRR